MRKNKSFLKIMLFLVPQAHISVCTSHISVWTSNRLLNITSQQLHFWSFPKKPAPQREILCVLAPFPNTVPLTQRWANATFVHHEHNIITCHEARVFNGKKKKKSKRGRRSESPDEVAYCCVALEHQLQRTWHGGKPALQQKEDVFRVRSDPNPTAYSNNSDA